MRYLDVGGAHLSVIGLGTWQFGSRSWGYGHDYNEREALAITGRALDLGINLIDTAELYGFGRSERIVGRTLAKRRQQAFVASKLAPFLPFDPIVERRAAGTLRRLGVGYLDLYQVHWPNPLFPLGPLFQALGRLQRSGTVRHIGVSNYSLNTWKAAEHELGGPVLSNQVCYNLVERAPEQELLSWAAEHDRVIIAYSPLAQGLLSGRDRSATTVRGVRASNPLFLPENLTRARELLGTLRDVAAAHDATPAQVALAWLIRRPNVVVIPGASSVAQLESNAAAADLSLTDEEDRHLSGASDRFVPLTGSATVAPFARSYTARARSALGVGRPNPA